MTHPWTLDLLTDAVHTQVTYLYVK